MVLDLMPKGFPRGVFDEIRHSDEALGQGLVPGAAKDPAEAGKHMKRVTLETGQGPGLRP